MTTDKLDALKDTLLNMSFHHLRILHKLARERGNKNALCLITKAMAVKGKLQQRLKEQEQKQNQQPEQLKKKVSRCFFCHRELDHYNPDKYSYCSKCRDYLATAPLDEIDDMRNHYSEISIVLGSVVECQRQTKLN